MKLRAFVVAALMTFAQPAVHVSPPVSHGPRDGKRVALTFDADFVPAWIGNGKRYVNDALLSLLRSDDVRATLFITGLWAEQYPAEMRGLARDPRFEIANHTWKHLAMRANCYRMHTISNDEDRDAVLKADEILARSAPHRSRFFRFPGGCYDSGSLAEVEHLGFIPVQWDVVSGDAFQRDASVIVRDVLTVVKPGSIVVAHMHGADRAPATAEAFKVIIPELRRRGYSFVTVSQLLHPSVSRRAAAVPKPAITPSTPAIIPVRRAGHWWLLLVIAAVASALIPAIFKRVRR